MKRLAPLLLLAAACPSGLEEQSHVSRLRVLGVQAEPPELVLYPDAGNLPATDLTALAVLPDGGPIETRFALCKAITQAPDPSLDCPGDAGVDLPDGGRLDLNDPRYLSLAAGLSAPDGGSLQAALDQGIPLLIGFQATAGSEVIRGFDVITLRSNDAGPADTNPRLTDLVIGNGDTPQPIHSTVTLQPVTAPKDDPGKQYLFSFYATDGQISSLHSVDVTATGEPESTAVDWTTPPQPVSAQLWVVLRDGRGGVSWLARTITVK